MPHTVTLRLNATIEIFYADSCDGAERIARDLLERRFLNEFPVKLPMSEMAGPLLLAFTVSPVVSGIGEGENTAPNP